MMYYFVAVGLNVAISTGLYWVGSTFINQLTPIIIDSVLGVVGYLYILMGFTLVGFFFVLFTLPETKVNQSSFTIMAEWVYFVQFIFSFYYFQNKSCFSCVPSLFTSASYTNVGLLLLFLKFIF